MVIGFILGCLCGGTIGYVTAAIIYISTHDWDDKEL